MKVPKSWACLKIPPIDKKKGPANILNTLENIQNTISFLVLLFCFFRFLFIFYHSICNFAWCNDFQSFVMCRWNRKKNLTNFLLTHIFLDLFIPSLCKCNDFTWICHDVFGRERDVCRFVKKKEGFLSFIFLLSDDEVCSMMIDDDVCYYYKI